MLFIPGAWGTVRQGRADGHVGDAEPRFALNWEEEI